MLKSPDETAAMLVRWAAELYGEWSNWMRYILPGCRTDYKKSTVRIVSKIREMYKDGKIQFLHEGWTRVLDMLRA